MLLPKGVSSQIVIFNILLPATYMNVLLFNHKTRFAQSVFLHFMVRILHFKSKMGFNVFSDKI